MEYKIYEGNIERLEKKLKRIKNKCKKNGNPFYYEILREETSTEKDKYGQTIHKKFYIVDVEGTAIKNDWEFVAKIDHYPEGNIFSGMSSRKIPEKYKNMECKCDHCNRTFRRNNSFLVYNTKTNEWKQLGRNCLAEYTAGLSANDVAGYISLHDELIIGDQVPDTSSAKFYIDKIDFLLFVAETVNQLGYVKKTKDFDEYGYATDDRTPTAIQAREFMDCYYKKLSPYTYQYEVERIMEKLNFNHDTEENKQKVANMLDWVLSFEENGTDYMNNLKVVCGQDYIEEKHFGLLASLPSAYFKWLEKTEKYKKEQELKKKSEYVGKPKDKIEINVKEMKFLRCVETGIYNAPLTYLYQFIDYDGNIYVWNSSKSLKDDRNEEYVITKLKGIIKEHKEYKGIKQTYITRCKIVERKETSIEMKTNEILKDLMDNGGFTNWQHWDEYECKDYVKSNYDCSGYIAEKVAEQIVNW